MESKVTVRIVKWTPEKRREVDEYQKRELAAALLRRHEARKARRAARNDEWMRFATELWAR
jgi:hypothetical protein